MFTVYVRLLVACLLRGVCTTDIYGGLSTVLNQSAQMRQNGPITPLSCVLSDWITKLPKFGYFKGMFLRGC